MAAASAFRDHREDVCRRHLSFWESSGVSGAVIVLVALLWRLLVFAAPEPVGYDESVYCAYAQLLGERGFDGLRKAARVWRDHEVFNKGSLPYRIGYLFPCAWACKFIGGYTPLNLARISFFFGLATVVIAWRLARRWCGPIYGVVTALLVAFSPLGTLLSARALQDSCFAFVIGLSLFFFDRCWRANRRSDVLWLGIVLLWGWLSKESMLFLYPAYLLMGLCYARDGWHGKLSLILPFLVAPLLHWAVVVWLSGGWKICWENYSAYAAMQRQIPYAVKFQAGPWFRYLVDWMLLSPLVVVLAIAGAAALPRNVQPVLAFTLGAVAVMSFLPILNVRFLLFLDPCVRLFAVVGVVAVSRRLRAAVRDQCVAALGLIVILLGSELFQFYRIVEGGGVYDPVTAELIRANGFIR